VILVSVYDIKVGAFMNPFVARSVGDAMRAFEDAVSDPKSGVAKHPEDYVLHQVAVWDEVEGITENRSIVLISGVQALAAIEKKGPLKAV